MSSIAVRSPCHRWDRAAPSNGPTVSVAPTRGRGVRSRGRGGLRGPKGIGGLLDDGVGAAAEGETVPGSCSSFRSRGRWATTFASADGDAARLRGRGGRPRRRWAERETCSCRFAPTGFRVAAIDGVSAATGAVPRRDGRRDRAAVPLAVLGDAGRDRDGESRCGDLGGG